MKNFKNNFVLYVACILSVSYYFYFIITDTSYYYSHYRGKMSPERTLLSAVLIILFVIDIINTRIIEKFVKYKSVECKKFNVLLNLMNFICIIILCVLVYVICKITNFNIIRDYVLK